MTANGSYYEILGVPRTATTAEIKAAYRRRALEVHPDTNPGMDTSQLFRKVQEAYDCLRNVRQRAAYDRKCQEQDSTARPSGQKRQPPPEPPPPPTEAPVNFYRPLAFVALAAAGVLALFWYASVDRSRTALARLEAQYQEAQTRVRRFEAELPPLRASFEEVNRIYAALQRTNSDQRISSQVTIDQLNDDRKRLHAEIVQLKANAALAAAKPLAPPGQPSSAPQIAGDDRVKSGSRRRAPERQGVYFDFTIPRWPR